MAILRADARAIPLRDASVQCVVTSVPYWGLRAYEGVPDSVWDDDPHCSHVWGKERIAKRRPYSFEFAEAINPGGSEAYKFQGQAVSQGAFCERCPAWKGQLGLENDIEAYVRHLVEMFREIRRVMREDATCWMEIADCYRDKTLCLVPFRVAIAFQNDGWFIRSSIVLSRPAVMPEAAIDRPTRSYTFLFLLTKSARYWYDATAIRERASTGTHSRGSNSRAKEAAPGSGIRNNSSFNGSTVGYVEFRNKRDVWTITSAPISFGRADAYDTNRIVYETFFDKSASGIEYMGPDDYSVAKCARISANKTELDSVADALVTRLAAGILDHNVDNSCICKYTGMAAKRVEHFAQFSCELVEPCILAGSRVGDVVLDPFGGTSTVGEVAERFGRRWVTTDLSWQYCLMGKERTRQIGLFSSKGVEEMVEQGRPVAEPVVSSPRQLSLFGGSSDGV